jgi:hypothetical protein
LTEHSLTLGELASRIGCESWRIRRLFERKLLPEPRRVGKFRVFSESDVEAVRKVAESAGYVSCAKSPDSEVEESTSLAEPSTQREVSS